MRLYIFVLIFTFYKVKGTEVCKQYIHLQNKIYTSV